MDWCSIHTYISLNFLDWCSIHTYISPNFLTAKINRKRHVVMLISIRCTLSDRRSTKQQYAPVRRACMALLSPLLTAFFSLSKRRVRSPVCTPAWHLTDGGHGLSPPIRSRRSSGGCVCSVTLASPERASELYLYPAGLKPLNVARVFLPIGTLPRDKMNLERDIFVFATEQPSFAEHKN